jgi:hypothetical protein
MTRVSQFRRAQASWADDFPAQPPAKLAHPYVSLSFKIRLLILDLVFGGLLEFAPFPATALGATDRAAEPGEVDPGESFHKDKEVPGSMAYQSKRGDRSR